MEKVKQTLESIAQFNRTAMEYLSKTEQDTKLTYALKRMVGDPTTRSKGILFPILRDYQTTVRDLHIEYATVDEKTKVLLKDVKGNYEYTKENMKELNKKLDELILVEHEFEPYIATEVVLEDLNEFELGAFKDFVIK